MVPRVLRLQLLTSAELAYTVEPRGLLSMEQLKDAYKCLVCHSRIVFRNVPLDACRKVAGQAEEQRGGLKWSFSLQLDNGRLRFVPACSSPLQVLTVSIFIGRQHVCEGRHTATGKPSLFRLKFELGQQHGNHGDHPVLEVMRHVRELFLLVNQSYAF
jgi:hypothetical protein